MFSRNSIFALGSITFFTTYGATCLGKHREKFNNAISSKLVKGTEPSTPKDNGDESYGQNRTRKRQSKVNQFQEKHNKGAAFKLWYSIKCMILTAHQC